MDIERIEALAQLVTKSAVSEVTVRTAETRITIRRAPGKPAQKRAELSRAEPRAAEPRAIAPRPEEAHASNGMQWVTAPLVGIFYHAEPPVTLGVEVKPGQVIGVIESMKLMNEVRSDHGGVVVESAIEAGMAVEYGQPLFAVRAAEQEADDAATN